MTVRKTLFHGFRVHWSSDPLLLLLLLPSLRRLIKGNLHRLQRDGLEVVNINATRQQLGLGMLRYKSRDEVGSNRKLLLGPIEKRWDLTTIGHADLTSSELVEEGVAESLNCCETGARSVLEKSRNEVNGIGRCARTEDFGEGVWSDLRELVLHVIGVHGLDLFSRRCTQNLDDLDKLVDTTLTGEERLPLHKLGHDTSCRPNVDVGGVVGCSEDELRSSVVSRADVADVGLSCNQDLGGTKVAELENASRRVEKQVLGLDVTVTDADRVDVGQTS